MCDYSLHHVATTPAKVGDKLVSTVFRASVTRGFSAVGAPEIAVCVPPGAELAFDNDVQVDRVFAFFRRKTIKARVARFRQVNLDQPYEHHDALEFPDGKIVMVTQLSPGQRATVLQLPAVPRLENREAAPAPAIEPAPAARRTRHGAF
jgi:hypothetical protein